MNFTFIFKINLIFMLSSSFFPLKYRMQPQISHFTNRLFYNNRLRDSDQVKMPEQRTKLPKLCFKSILSHNKNVGNACNKTNEQTLQPMLIIDVDSGYERQTEWNLSRINRLEQVFTSLSLIILYKS